MPPSNNPVVGEKDNGHGRRRIVVLACQDDRKGLLSTLVLSKKHVKQRENSLLCFCRVGEGNEKQIWAEQ